MSGFIQSHGSISTAMLGDVTVSRVSSEGLALVAIGLGGMLVVAALVALVVGALGRTRARLAVALAAYGEFIVLGVAAGSHVTPLTAATGFAVLLVLSCAGIVILTGGLVYMATLPEWRPYRTALAFAYAQAMGISALIAGQYQQSAPRYWIYFNLVLLLLSLPVYALSLIWLWRSARHSTRL